MTKRNEFMKKFGERKDLVEMAYEARWDAVIHGITGDEDLMRSFAGYLDEDWKKPLEEELE